MTTVAGTMLGVDHVAVATIETTVSAATVTEVIRRECLVSGGTTFGASIPVDGPFAAGVGAGAGAFHVIELWMPAVLTGPASIPLGIVGTNDAGDEFALLTTTPGGGAPILLTVPSAVPISPPSVMLVAAALAIAIAFASLRRRGTTIAVLIVAASAAAAAQSFSFRFDWSGQTPLASTSDSTPDDGADVRAFYAQVATGATPGLAFRLDASLEFEPEPAMLVVTGSPLVIPASGAAGTLTITNSSASVTVTNVASDLSGTALDGLVTETGNTCGVLAPGASCSLAFSAGATGVAATSFPITGGLAHATSAEVAVPAVGLSYRGGIIYELNPDGVTGKIAPTFDSAGPPPLTILLWGRSSPGDNGPDGADSVSDGATNTANIVDSLGSNGGEAYAAQTCDVLSVTDGGATYDDWYLPATGELLTLWTNRATVGGFAGGIYWSSTEDADPESALARFWSNGTQVSIGKSNSMRVRCISRF